VNDRLAILNFHGIGRPTRALWPREEAYWIEQDFFEAVLDAVNGREDVLITFDDCNISDFELGLPALKARKMRAHFYIVTDFVGKKGFLSKENIRTLHESGMSIGNHGKQHRAWRGLSEMELNQELIEARDYLQETISDRVRFAACPNGSYDRRVLRHLRRSGYERVYTSDGGWTRAGDWLQARNSVLRRQGLDFVQSLCNAGYSWDGLIRICKRAIKKMR
jgi:peptidoglycan/xylan/chitin deacetylase (PgdA/CDA1 family)